MWLHGDSCQGAIAQEHLQSSAAARVIATHNAFKNNLWDYSSLAAAAICAASHSWLASTWACTAAAAFSAAVSVVTHSDHKHADTLARRSVIIPYFAGHSPCQSSQPYRSMYDTISLPKLSVIAKRCRGQLLSFRSLQALDSS